MKRKISFKRGQLVQDNENTIYIFVKKNGDRSHLVELNALGDPVELVLLETQYIGPLKNIPETFKSIDIIK